MDRGGTPWRAIYITLKAQGAEAIRLQYPRMADNYQEVARVVLADLESERQAAEANALKVAQRASRLTVIATWATALFTALSAMAALVGLFRAR